MNKSNRRVSGLALLAFAGALSAVSACAMGGFRVVEPPYNQTEFDTALREVAKGGQWSPERGKAFRNTLDNLPGRQRFEAMRQLASAINTKAIQVPTELKEPLF